MYDNPSYVGRAVLTAGAGGAVQLVWEEEAEAVEVDADAWDMQLVEEADGYDYQAGVSLYPHGYGRFAEQPREDDEEEDDGDDAVMGEGEKAEQGGKKLRQDEHEQDEDEEEHVDDYGLIQGEVLEGEDRTDAPAAAQRRLRGLPAARGRRVQLGRGDGNKVAEQGV